MKKTLTLSAITSGLLLWASLAFGQITNPIGSSDFSSLLLKIADAVGKLIASLGAVMIIVAGIFYLTSAGSTERIGVAKKALIYAIVGIFIGLAASSIVSIVQNIVGAT